MKVDYCGKCQARCWYFQAEAWLAEGKGGWKASQDEEEGTENPEVSTPQSIDVLEVLNSCTLGSAYPSSTASVCVLSGCVQP